MIDREDFMQRTDKLLVISSFPPLAAVHHPSIVGGASYTKNTLLAIKKLVTQEKNLEITILAEKLKDIPYNYIDEEMIVKRVWKRNKLSSFFQIDREIKKNKTTQNILFSVELAMFGGKFSLIGIALFSLWLKLKGKRLFIVMHQVITDIEEFEGHLGKANNSLLNKINNFFLIMFYRLILFASFRTIVFEETFKDHLAKLANKNKIAVIPHGVEEFPKRESKTEARKKLNIALDKRIILVFGFLAWYKGTDWIVEIADKEDLKNENTQIIIAGGPNPNRLELPFYKDYLKELEKAAREKDILITGFVPEDKIGLYFEAADLVLFPYRALMSSSGPFSMALSFQKPFLLSDKLSPLIKTSDFTNSLDKVKLNEENVLFPISGKGFEKILKSISDQKLLGKIEELSSYLSETRSWRNIGNLYSDILQGS